MRNNKVHLYYGLIFVLLILIGVSTFFLCYFYNLRGEDLSLEDLDISEKSQLTYNVKLKDNQFYKSNLETTSYVTSMIENISTYFNFSEAFSSKVEGEYSYYIVGDLVMNDNGNQATTEVYRSQINKYQISGNVINLSDQFNIDVNNVISDYNNFKTEANINVSSYLRYKIVFNFAVFSDKISKSVSKTYEQYLMIPITDITNITKSDDKENVVHEFSELNYDDDKMYVIICLEFIGAIIIFILLIVLCIKRVMGRESIYDYEIRTILTKYKNSIVSLKELPDLSKYDVLFVDAFEDILDASYSINTPINYFEVIEDKSSTFIVYDKNNAYVYKVDKKNI